MGRAKKLPAEAANGQAVLFGFKPLPKVKRQPKPKLPKAPKVPKTKQVHEFDVAELHWNPVHGFLWRCKQRTQEYRLISEDYVRLSDGVVLTEAGDADWEDTLSHGVVAYKARDEGHPDWLGSLWFRGDMEAIEQLDVIQGQLARIAPDDVAWVRAQIARLRALNPACYGVDAVNGWELTCLLGDEGSNSYCAPLACLTGPNGASYLVRSPAGETFAVQAGSVWGHSWHGIARATINTHSHWDRATPEAIAEALADPAALVAAMADCESSPVRMDGWHADRDQRWYGHEAADDDQDDTPADDGEEN